MSPRQEVSSFIDSVGNIPLSVLPPEVFPGVVWQKNYLVWLKTKSRIIFTTLYCEYSSSSTWIHALAWMTDWIFFVMETLGKIFLWFLTKSLMFLVCILIYRIVFIFKLNGVVLCLKCDCHQHVGNLPNYSQVETLCKLPMSWWYFLKSWSVLYLSIYDLGGDVIAQHSNTVSCEFLLSA